MSTFMKVRVTFTDPILGTQPNDPEIHSRFVASKAPDAKTMEEEVAELGAEEVEERGKTVFSKMEDGTPLIRDYQIRGFIKETLHILYGVKGSRVSKDKSNYRYRSKVDKYIFVSPKFIPLWMPIDLDLADTDCQRPLRASTPMGERIALAHSEEAPEGTYVEFTIECQNKEDMPYVRDCLDYGSRKGLGQWRNSGKGRFTWEEIESWEQKQSWEAD